MTEKGISGVTEIATGTETGIVIATVTGKESATETAIGSVTANEKAKESRTNRMGNTHLMRLRTRWTAITWIWWTRLAEKVSHCCRYVFLSFNLRERAYVIVIFPVWDQSKTKYREPVFHLAYHCIRRL